MGEDVDESNLEIPTHFPSSFQDFLHKLVMLLISCWIKVGIYSIGCWIYNVGNCSIGCFIRSAHLIYWVFYMKLAIVLLDVLYEVRNCSIGCWI